MVFFCTASTEIVVKLLLQGECTNPIFHPIDVLFRLLNDIVPCFTKGCVICRGTSSQFSHSVHHDHMVGEVKVIFFDGRASGQDVNE